MPNPYFQMKAFTVYHDRCAMKVTTDACLFGAWTAARLQQEHTGKMLDIGTGSGLLSLMVAQQCSLTIDAVEKDAAAAVQAAENVRRSPWQERIRIIAADIKTFEDGHYNVIFTNPPFYANDLPSPDAGRQAAHHNSGLRLAELIPIMATKLVPGGRFFMLFPYKSRAALEALLLQHGLFVHAMTTVRQSPAHDPFRIMIEGRKGMAATVIEDEMAIRGAGGAYTPAFTRLLKPYYLYL